MVLGWKLLFDTVFGSRIPLPDSNMNGGWRWQILAQRRDEFEVAGVFVDLERGASGGEGTGRERTAGLADVPWALDETVHAAASNDSGVV